MRQQNNRHAGRTKWKAKPKINEQRFTLDRRARSGRGGSDKITVACKSVRTSKQREGRAYGGHDRKARGRLRVTEEIPLTSPQDDVYGKIGLVAKIMGKGMGYHA